MPCNLQQVDEPIPTYSKEGWDKSTAESLFFVNYIPPFISFPELLFAGQHPTPSFPETPL